MLTPEQIARIRAIALEGDGLTFGGESVVVPLPSTQENLVVQVEPGHLNPTGEIEFNATRNQLNDMIAAAIASGGLWNTAYGGGGGNVASNVDSVPDVQCGPGQVKVRGVCVDWDGPSGGNGGGQGNPDRRGPSTTGTGYLGAGAGPTNTGIGQAGQSQATPWADAYFRAKERANAQGPVSRLFAKELEGN